MPSRIQRPTPIRTTLSRKGMRQPQIRNWSPVIALNTRKAPLARIRPTGTPNCGQLPTNPRRPSLFHSRESNTEPPHSPPMPMPCSARSTVRIIAAHTPSWVYVGSRPMSRVPMPMTSRVAISVTLRPSRSP